MNEVAMNEPAEQVQQSAHVEQEQVRTPTQKGKHLLSTPWPWMLLTAPLIGGCVWLASHPEIITNNINQPYALLAAPVLIGSIIAGLLIYKFFQSIITGCQSAWQAFQRARKEDGSAQFFWIVIIVFLLVSVCASGSFFQTLEKNALPGIGYITALFIDLVAVQAMRARLNAVRMRDKKGSRLYLAGVLLCSGASAFANVYTSLSDFQSVKTGALPDWMVSVAPWFGLVFPAMILLLSVTADYTLDQVSTKLDPEQYKEQEAKRTKLLEYQLEALQQRVQFEADIDRLTHRMKERREFFLVRWFFPKSAPSVVQIVDQVVDEMRSLYDPQLQIVSDLVEEIKTLRSDIERQQKAQQMTPLIEPRLETQMSQPLIHPVSPVDDRDRQLADERFLDGIDDGDDDLFDEVEINTEDRESVNIQVTPQPRITVKLDEYHAKQERNTDALKLIKKASTKRASNPEGEAVKSIRRLLKRNPDMAPIDIAKKVGVTRQYASKIKSQVINELAGAGK